MSRQTYYCDMYRIFMAGLLTVTLRLLQRVRLPRMVRFSCLDLLAETSVCGTHCTDMARHWHSRLRHMIWA